MNRTTTRTFTIKIISIWIATNLDWQNVEGKNKKPIYQEVFGNCLKGFIKPCIKNENHRGLAGREYTLFDNWNVIFDSCRSKQRSQAIALNCSWACSQSIVIFLCVMLLIHWDLQCRGKQWSKDTNLWIINWGLADWMAGWLAGWPP